MPLSWENQNINRGLGNVLGFLDQDPQSLYGGQTDYLTNLLQGIISGNSQNPEFGKIRASAQRSIGRATDEALTETQQRLSSSGFRGAGANIVSDIFRNKQSALGEVESGIGQLGFGARQDAISQLLGLNQMQTGVNAGLRGQQANAGQSIWQFLQGGKWSNEQAQGDPWGSIFGSIASAAPYAAIALSDKRTKENIKKTGEKTNDGIPIVEFNYKGDDKRYRGVIAQDVEKKKPSAVYKAVDYSKL